MAVIKCKMCGGDIEFTPGDSYGTCLFCDSVSTLPKAESEQTLNLHARANHLRRLCEFDKAASVYERILEKDDVDAEAHWGAVLCRYGIEYVEDPATKKRIPTCHRVQIASVLTDDDYISSMKYAPDETSRRIYKEQAARIAEIQRDILAISQNEKPYDVFICYKETDEYGRRTHDSQWAQEIYYGLTDAGCKVFFSRITLEDKIGQQYEPYIFAALNSAKVMLVIASKAEYVNSVWVKNEWSRYLKLMEKDRNRLLIPCYRNMDPYDLPEEMSMLQCQDMGRIGFMQDLLRGIKKVLDAEKVPEIKTVIRETMKEAPQAAQNAAAPGVESLLDRAYLFMEDGEFDKASEYLERVLDINPRYAPAYVAKVCASLKLHKESELAEASSAFDENPDWKKALRFADEMQKQRYESYAARVHEKTSLRARQRADAERKAENASQAAHVQAERNLKALAVGDSVTFGHYPQTSSGADNTPIEWIVLENDGKRALLLSQYGLDAKPYNTSHSMVTWETCTLRKWLNDGFMNRAFTKEEQTGILLTHVDNSKNQGYSYWNINGGNNTQDYIFLLSYAEAHRYLGVTDYDSNNTKSRVSPTAYAEKQGAYTSSSYKTADCKYVGWWWLRSPGLDQDCAACVFAEGSLDYFLVTLNRGSIRPALWVNLGSDIFKS